MVISLQCPLNNGIFRSTNNGDDWTRINDKYINALCINHKGYIFAGTDNRVLRSIDNGNTWTDINLGLTELNILSFAVNDNDEIFCGTANGFLNLL